MEEVTQEVDHQGSRGDQSDMGGWGDKDHEEDAGDDHTNQDHEYPNNQDDQEDQE